ncbi:MAG: NusA antitermination factor [candidate division WS6 bacterium GW2011_GWA2_37_6]|uniref:Transcription termination/antitermination protein NusA n=1 Tax=candidate division WS6 bacterium GW2011_GWA2_37_6 TaxID=1619087 RepID=A0A0G0JGU9_9BACT|nr:MAG: NusA antitermination factor [candidate division WS6 bacterium GW2011_GWA2_37_6]
MAVQTDFMVAVNQIAAERGIDATLVIEAIKQAIETGFRRDNEEEEGLALHVEIDSKVGTIAVVADKKVVDEVTNPSTQISIKDAKKIEPKLREGDHIQVDITPEGDFGRVAAQAAKQVILQKIREAEKESQIKEFEGRIGEVESAIVQRMDGDSVVWEINRATAIMKPEDRVSTEFYKSGARLKVLLKSIEEGPRGKSLFVSRSHPDFLKALFELEIPELVSGSIDIKAIAREAGSRSKIAVYSNVEGIDPIGSCVGQKGVRINAIMNELKVGSIEEKVDIILWDADTQQFISNALSPAQTVAVKILDKENKVAQVIVPDEQLSLAIGKDGQNVRLAAKLTGWKIDIQGETVKVESQVNAKKEEKKDTKGKKKAKKAVKKTKKVAKKPVKKVAKKVTKKAIKKVVKKKVEKKKTTKKAKTKAAKK